jgi:hypothetical protein
MYSFHKLFPERAEAETRTVTVLPREDGSTDSGIPAGEYGLLEAYCVEPGCDCRRVMINVIGRSQQRHLVTINHSFEPPPPDDVIDEQTFLDPLNPQCSWSGQFLKLFLNVVLTADYSARLERHYRMVKDALADPGHPIHGRIPAEPSFSRPRRSGNPADRLVPRRYPKRR